ncbi:MAG TPA: hypothetical protein VF559_09160 [Caulobacteraceae bacterium]|jgi:hypothetical protein
MLSALAALLLGAWTGAERWAPPGISSPLFESHAAFDPLTGDLYLVRSSKAFRGWRILRSRCGPGGWSEPEPAAFAGDGAEADPWFTPNGRGLYFISTRSEAGVKQGELDIWRVRRGQDGRWGQPERLPEPVNSPGQEWFPRLSSDGWLYFGSDRPGGQGGTDIWRARARAAGWRVENLGPRVNGPGDDYEPLPLPDGERLIVMADGDLYETRKTGRGWAPRTRLGPDVNSAAMEVGPALSPSGRTLLFARDTGPASSGEFFLARLGRETWPPACPAKAR